MSMPMSQDEKQPMMPMSTVPVFSFSNSLGSENIAMGPLELDDINYGIFTGSREPTTQLIAPKNDDNNYGIFTGSYEPTT